MDCYDLCVAWNWPYDADFIRVLEETCRQHGLSMLQVTPENLETTLQALTSQTLVFRSTLNRASDSDPRFLSLIHWVALQGWFRINPRERESRAADKATMHLEFISNGIHTPYTIILPPYQEQPDLAPIDLSPLGQCFAIKPARGGGGDGVVVGATTMDQIWASRREYPHDSYLVQAHIEPVRLDSCPAWFRVIYCTGQVYASWWTAENKVYRPVTAEEESRFGLAPLQQVVAAIARLSRLHFFSTEIALTAEGQFVAVDYVNDQIDLRLQSVAPDGVPDAIAGDMARRLVELVRFEAVSGDRSTAKGNQWEKTNYHDPRQSPIPKRS